MPKSKETSNLILQPKDLYRLKGGRVCLDVETTGLQWWSNKLIGIGVWCPDDDVYGYIPTLTDLERREAKDTLAKAIPQGTVIIAHNAKFDLHFMEVNPKALGWNILDTTVLIHLLDSRYRKSAVEAEEMFLGSTTKKEYIAKQPPSLRKKIWEWPVMDVARYCINDARVEYRLAEKLVPEVYQEGLWDLFTKEMEYLALILEVERIGVLLDVEFVMRARKSLEVHVANFQEMLFDAVGYEFNWNSHKQLSQALYDDMGHPRPENPFTLSRFNKDRGKYNSTLTSTFILMEKAHHPLGELMSTLREAKKLVQYLDRWLKLKDSDDILHTDFNLTGTRTGRLSSGSPNLQNIPSEFRNRFTQAVFTGSVERSEEYNLRNAIVARPGNSFVSVDYRQMEMRMFGILSKDPFMLKSLAAGRDIHADIAEQVWGSRDRVYREWAKTISFGLIYGMTTGSLQFKLDLTLKKAKEITDQYWSTFPNIRPWLYGTADECREKGYVTYWSGRRWVESDENSYFKAANALIQGGCADVLSIAALRVDEYLEKTGYVRSQGVAHISNLVHDEIVVEVSSKVAPRVAKDMAKIMQVPDLFGIPWFTDAKIGTTYGNMEKLTIDTGPSY